MATHNSVLESLCRVCGFFIPPFRKDKKTRTTTHAVADHADELLHYFNINTTTDTPDVHPATFCDSCRSYLRRASSSSSSDFRTPTLYLWQPHGSTTPGPCKVCSGAEDRRKGGTSVSPRNRRRHAQRRLGLIPPTAVETHFWSLLPWPSLQGMRHLPFDHPPPLFPAVSVCGK
eukprot:scpid24553/ scgid15587/ 